MEELIGISTHALERFKERWEILKGKKIKECNVLRALQSLILKSRPELGESPILLQRKEKHGGNIRYMVSGPWRLIWRDNCLVTVELQRETAGNNSVEQHKVNIYKKMEKERIERLIIANGIPKTRVKHYR